MSDLSSFPITKRWPARHPGAPPALFAADAERRQGLDHAGGDRAALRSRISSTSARTTRRHRNFCRSIRTARSRRSSIPTVPAAGRCGCSSPARSCNISPRRPASCCRRIPRGAIRRSSGCISRWAASGRCSARSASSTNSPARNLRTSGRCERYVSRGQASARRAGNAARRAGNGSWMTTTPSPTSRCSAGCAISIGFYGARELVGFEPVQARAGLAGTRACAAGGAARAEIPKRP